MPSILITGCSSGIGLAAARTLARQDWHVVATARKEADVDRLRAEGLTAERLDYADPTSVADGFEAALALTDGRLDAVFNNGAFATPGAVEDMLRAALAEIFEANVFGWHDLTRRAVAVMRPQGHGRIVQCSSVLGLVAVPWRGAYTATKFAIEALSDTLRLEMRGTGIHVILIEPGPISTRIRENGEINFRRWIDWEASPRAAQYRDDLIPRLTSDRRDPFQLEPAAVVGKLIRALEAPRPRARYYVTTPTYLAAALRVLPTRIRDRMLARG